MLDDTMKIFKKSFKWHINIAFQIAFYFPLNQWKEFMKKPSTEEKTT